MKQCPRCQKTYNDPGLNFCLEDGELLLETSSSSSGYPDQSPPTVVMNEARRTNPTDWPAGGQQQSGWQQPQTPAPYQQPAFGQYAIPAGASQTLAVVSLGLGIGSMTIGWCCYLGLLLAPAALITGFIALSQIKKDPEHYTGRGFAIGGIATAAAHLVLFLLIIIIYGAAIFFSGMR